MVISFFPLNHHVIAQVFLLFCFVCFVSRFANLPSEKEKEKKRKPHYPCTTRQSFVFFCSVLLFSEAGIRQYFGFLAKYGSKIRYTYCLSKVA